MITSVRMVIISQIGIPHKTMVCLFGFEATNQTVFVWFVASVF